MSGDRSTRRRVLAKVRACAIAIGGATTVIGEPQNRSANDSVSRTAFEELDLAPELLPAGSGEIDETDSPAAVWQYAMTDTGFVATSPINVVVVPGDRGLDDVRAAFEDDNWYADPEEYVRHARDPDGRFVPQQWTYAESAYGAMSRHHLRSWAFDGVVSMQAHEDTASIPKHGVESYRRTKRRVEGLFADAGWRIAPDALEFGNGQPPDHDGTMT